MRSPLDPVSIGDVSVGVSLPGKRGDGDLPLLARRLEAAGPTPIWYATLSGALRDVRRPIRSSSDGKARPRGRLAGGSELDGGQGNSRNHSLRCEKSLRRILITAQIVGDLVMIS